MRATFLAGLTVLTVLVAFGADDTAVKKDMAALQGECKSCFGKPGAERPTDFTSTPGDGRTLSVWKREKAAAAPADRK